MWKWSDLKRLLTRKASSMRDTADLGAVMWPVVYPNPQDPSGGTIYVPKDPHVTVVIFTDINNPNLGYTREDVMDAVQQTMYDVYLWLTVEGVEWFGEDQNIPVLRVEHDYLHAFRKGLLVELEARGIPVDMKFPEYKPHVTIPDAAALDGVYPLHLFAGPVEVWWGNEHYQLPDTGYPKKVGL